MKTILVSMCIDEAELDHAHRAYVEEHGKPAESDIVAIANDIQRCCYDDGSMHGSFRVISVDQEVRPPNQATASEAGVYSARGIRELHVRVGALAQDGFRIVSVIDTQNGDYHVVAQRDAKAGGGNG